MKRVVFIIISALICGMMFISCVKSTQSEQKTIGGLYVIGTKSGTVPIDKKDNIVFTGNDIVSFNVTNDEIVFVGKKVDEIISRLSLYSEFHFFIDNETIFVPPIPIMHLKGDRYCGSPLPWASMNDLGLLILNSKTCFLIEGYLPWHFLSDNENDREEILKNQEDNSKKRKKELEVFIEYLRDAGKIVE